MDKKETEEKDITQCPHCGNKTPHHLLHSADFIDKIEANGATYDYPINYRLWRCSTCEGISLYLTSSDDYNGDPEETYFDIANLVYPDEKKFESTVPEIVRRSYIEARKVKQISAYAFAILIRKALEQVCLDQGAKGHSLKEKIGDLAKKDIIPKNLVRMADALRFLGNVGAHEVNYNFGWEEVRAMDDFLIAVIEYVYVAPQKVKRLADSINIKRNAKKPV